MIIEKPGLLTTIQDLGRTGYKQYGIIASGAMDQTAHRIANMLVLNPEETETVEITMGGPVIRFQEKAVIAMTGGHFSPAVNGQPVKMYRPLLVDDGDVLSFGHPKNGLRCYLAVHGGFSIENVMHSKSTYLRAGIGGYKGRALEKGDEIQLKAAKPIRWTGPMKWSAESFRLHDGGTRKNVRVLPGLDYDAFTEESRAALIKKEFIVKPESDRMGYRLEGERLSLKKQTEFISEAVSFGTIQVPADGQPIILMADSQTLGGYAKIAQVATVDQAVVAQAKPGDRLTFEMISLKEAQRLLLEQERELKILKRAIQMKYS